MAHRLFLRPGKPDCISDVLVRFGFFIGPGGHMKKTDGLLTPGDVMKILGIGYETLKNWDRRGVLKSERNDLGWRTYRRSDIDRIRRRIRSTKSGPKLQASVQ